MVVTKLLPFVLTKRISVRGDSCAQSIPGPRVDTRCGAPYLALPGRRRALSRSRPRQERRPDTPKATAAGPPITSRSPAARLAKDARASCDSESVSSGVSDLEPLPADCRSRAARLCGPEVALAGSRGRSVPVPSPDSSSPEVGPAPESLGRRYFCRRSVSIHVRADVVSMSLSTLGSVASTGSGRASGG